MTEEVLWREGYLQLLSLSVLEEKGVVGEVGESSHLSYKPLVNVMGIRDTLEIMAEILSLCREPQIKTRVMYGAGLSWRMVNKYLSQLQSMGLLEVHYSPTKYATTQKGIEFLRKWRELKELL